MKSHLIRLNMVCNENCIFCNVTKETEPYYKDKGLRLILEEVKTVIIQNGGSNNVKISLSGGEPTLRKDLLEIVLGINKLGVNYIEIQTNAILLKKIFVEKLIKAGVNKFFISFHSHKKNIYEEYVGTKDIFNQVVNNIKNLGNYGNIEVIFNPVISRINYSYLKSYFDYIKKEFPFIKYISLSFIQPRGRAFKNIKLMVDYKLLNDRLSGILNYAYNLGFVVNNPYCGLPMCIIGWHKYLNNNVEYIENISKYKIFENKLEFKSYIKKCKKCKYYLLCGGIWNEYIDIYGDKGINPIIK